MLRYKSADAENSDLPSQEYITY